MTKFTSCLLLIATVCTMVVAVAPQQAHAQDPEFSQFYSNPLLLNPAFAGTARGPRVVMSHRNQWPAMSGAFVTQAVSYDQHFSSIQGGLGLTVMHDQAGQNTLNTTRITGMYSYQQAITRKLSSARRARGQLLPEGVGLEQPDLRGHDRSAPRVHLRDGRHPAW